MIRKGACKRLYTARNFIVAQSLEQAWELNQKKANAILGGGCWMRMGRRRYDTLIDLSGLGLDRIEERDGFVELGAMVTLRQLETSPVLQTYFGSYFQNCTQHIVGVQFRNCATLGGSVAARFGFSDLVTALLPLNSQVVLVKGGVVPMEEYAAMAYDRDVVSHIRIPLPQQMPAYESARNTQTDLPTLTCAVARQGQKLVAALGARSSRPSTLWAEDVDGLLAQAEQLDYVDNMRASGAYRKHLAKVLIKRACARLEGGEAQ